MHQVLNLPVADHGITNLLLRSAASMPDGKIVVVATGSKAGMPAEIGGILLHFSVSSSGNKPELRLSKTQFFFPSITPKMLAEVMVVSNGD